MFVSHLTRQRLSFIFLLNEYTLIQNRRRGNICHGRKRQTSVYGRSAEGRFSMLRPGCLPARDWRVRAFSLSPPPATSARGPFFATLSPKKRVFAPASRNSRQSPLVARPRRFCR